MEILKNMLEISKKVFTQTLKWIAAAMVLALLAGWGYERLSESQDQKRFKPFGRIVPVHGVPMHILCRGEGACAVVIDSALGFSSLNWLTVQNKLAQKARVCTYDRAGYGWSHPIPGSRNSFHMAFELHELLTAAGEKPPYILVGHGLGALNLRFFALLYPDEVAGMVLLDPIHEDFRPWLPEARTSASERFWDEATLLLSGLGLHRYLSRNFMADNFPKFPNAVRLPAQALHSKPLTLKTAYRENLALHESLELMSEQKNSLESIPLTVISSGGKGLDQQFYQKIISIHKQLAEESLTGKHIILEDSGHFIHHDHPEKIIDEIEGQITFLFQ